MGEQRTSEYAPDHVSAPGETLQDMLDALGMTQAELAQRTGRTPKTINEIIKAKAPITSETAVQLERVLRVPARFWGNRERRYQEFLARRKEEERLREQVDWLRRFPVKQMAEFGWIRRFRDRVAQLQEVLTFFGVVSPEQWEEVWCAQQAAFRKSAAFTSDRYALAAWLRRGTVIGQATDCLPYDGAAFRDALQRARALTVEEPDRFVSQLTQLCCQCGVVIAFVRALPRTRASGATQWLSSTRALIQLSLRYKSNDQLWFSFFHEAAHILLHGKRDVFIDEGSSGSEKEKEADHFASDILVPPDAYRSFVNGGRFTKAAIRGFGRQIGVAPGIVVGRLQHDGYLGWETCNDLKVRLYWGS